MSPRKIVIHAVHDRDVSKFWDSLSLPMSMECSTCGKKVTVENVGSFAPIKGRIEVSCEDWMCMLVLKAKKRLIHEP